MTIALEQAPEETDLQKVFELLGGAHVLPKHPKSALDAHELLLEGPHCSISSGS